MPRFALLLLLAGCGPRTPVIAVREDAPEPPPVVVVAPEPRAVLVRAAVVVAPPPRAKVVVLPKVEAPRVVVVPPQPDPREPAVLAAVTAARSEWEKRQKQRSAGITSAAEVDDAEAALHGAAAQLAEVRRDAKGERAAREAEVKVLTRQHDRAAEAHRRGAESSEGLDARLAALAAGRVRLAEFERDQPALVREHGVLVEIYRRQLEREQKAFAGGSGTKAQVQECEAALSECRRRLAAAEALRLTPRRVD